VTVENLLEVYGYPALFAGTFLEGETPLLMAGFLAHRGYFSLPLVMVVAFAGTLSSDQLFFHLGRSRGRAYLDRRPAWKSKTKRIESLLDRHGLPLIIGFRFLYGLRTVTPFAVGMSGYDPIRFLVINILGGALWSAVIGLAGYGLGGVLSIFVRDLRPYELPILVVIALVSLGIWIVRSRRESTARNGRGGSQEDGHAPREG
jgi:membrane protein DedA with SNARE-associated domain